MRIGHIRDLLQPDPINHATETHIHEHNFQSSDIPWIKQAKPICREQRQSPLPGEKRSSCRPSPALHWTHVGGFDPPNTQPTKWYRAV